MLASLMEGTFNERTSRREIIMERLGKTQREEAELSSAMQGVTSSEQRKIYSKFSLDGF